MNENLLFQFPKLIRQYRFLILLFLSVNSLAETSIPKPDFAYDSLNAVLQNIETDTVKFEILRNYFWKYADTDFDRVKPIGEWAWREIEHSKNLKALSDGYDIKGCILEKESKYDSAYVFFLKALSISKQIGHHPRTGWSYYHLGKINESKGNLDSTFFYLKTLYLFDVDKKYNESACDVLIEIGSIYQKYNQNDSALLYYNKLLQFSTSKNLKVKELKAHFALIDFYDHTNNTAKKLATINEVLVKAENAKDDKALISIYSTIGDLFMQKKNYDIASVYFYKILDRCRLKDKYTTSVVLNKLGDLYLKEGNDSLALSHTLKGLQLAEEIKFKHQVSESYKNLGTIYNHQGKLAEALNSFEICYQTGCDECAKIVFHYSLINIADLYLKLGNSENALEYYNQSLTLAEEFKSKSDLALSNLKIGNYYRNFKDDLSEKYYLSAIQFSKESKNISLIESVADTLSQFYNLKKDYKRAYDYLILSQTMTDSLNQIEQQSTMAEWETRFEFEKINNENKAKKEEIEKQKLYRNGAFLISGLLVIFGLVFYGSYRRKRSDNLILKEQKKSIDEKNLEILNQIREITVQKNEIERISSELHHSDEMKLRFFANVSHELRTPLTLILNPAKNLLDSTTENGEIKKQLGFIYNNALKLHDLTNQIMDLQKLDAGKLQLNLENADIVDHCLGIASSFESICDRKENRISFSANHRAVFTRFDRDKIGKILSNLLSNAFKFCYEKSVIDVNIHISESYFNLSVTDTGIGIPKDQINNIFKLYYQVSPKNQSDGTGIGLAYVKELVEYMGGKVSVISNESGGTKMMIGFPVDEVKIVDCAEYTIGIPKMIKKSGNGEFNIQSENDEERSTVLIVEDNDELRAFIADLLKADCNLYTADNGINGLNAAFEVIPDVIISDVMMPGMDGFEMCATLKNDERTSHIPIILLTAKDSPQSNLEGYQTGADDYIVKPFENEILRLKLRNIISTREATRKQFDFKSILSVEKLKLGNTDREFIKKCLLHIEKNLGNQTFGVDQLAEELAFSTRNFYRKIKSLTNQTPAELIRIYRLQFAKNLVQTTNMRVYEIAEAVGYDDVKRFSQAFKKQFDKLPSELTENTAS